jgi:hypothetical protein
VPADVPVLPRRSAVPPQKMCFDFITHRPHSGHNTQLCLTLTNHLQIVAKRLAYQSDAHSGNFYAWSSALQSSAPYLQTHSQPASVPLPHPGRNHLPVHENHHRSSTSRLARGSSAFPALVSCGR